MHTCNCCLPLCITHAVKRDILIENIHWVIEISPINGWAPSWFGGCLAAVVIGSILIAMLVLWLLLTMEMQVCCKC